MNGRFTLLAMLASNIRFRREPIPTAWSDILVITRC